MTDEHGITARDTAEVTTRNVAPTVRDVHVRARRARRTVSLRATASDPGAADTHAATVDWGDGTTGATTVHRAGGRITLRADHTYVTRGRHRITVTVRDDDGGTDTWTCVPALTPRRGGSPCRARSR